VSRNIRAAILGGPENLWIQMISDSDSIDQDRVVIDVDNVVRRQLGVKRQRLLYRHAGFT
jgi:hypothetical protein